MVQINLMGETGTSGLVQFAGQVQEAFVSKLYWPAAYSVYDEMRRRDPTIRTLWNALILLARTAEWYAVPGGQSRGDGEASRFLQSAIEDMNHAFEDGIEDALSCVLFGWSWLELVYKRRDDGRIGWRKWPMRRQSSFAEWKFDGTGGVHAMVQRPAPDYQDRVIPIEKSLHFTSQRDGGNPEGFALLESVYEPWHYIKNFQILQGIGWERSFVGLPVFEYEEAPGEDDKAAVEELGQKLVVAEKQYVAVPKGIKFGLESVSNRGADALLETIKYYRLLMLQALLADFIDLGTGQTGSWALGSDKSQLFLMAVDGFLDRLAAVINRFAVARLMQYNHFDGMTANPMLTHSKVEKPHLSQLGSWLQQISGLLTWTPEDENWLRRRADMPIGGSAVGGDGVYPDPEGDSADLAEGADFAQLDARAEIENKLERAAKAFLAAQRGRVADVAEAGGNPGEDDAFWEGEDELMRTAMLQQLMRYVSDLSGIAIEQVQASFSAGADWALVNADAAAWAREHAGELISGINGTTRTAVKESVKTWIESGGELRDLNRVLEPIFGQSRASLIGSTEVTRAYAEANDLVFQQLGLPAATFKPPAHPRCRCFLRPVFIKSLGQWVIVWMTARDERVNKQPLTTPWGEVSGDAALHGVIVSAPHAGKLLSEVQ